jgi:phosphoglycerate dehydrogenase-like enzyme
LVGIGSALGERALAFGMRVVGLRRTKAPSPVAGVQIVTSLDELLAVTDHLVIAAPATPRTQHLLDRDAFAKVKPGVHIVNIARGALIDQDALHEALDDGRVAMATLDTVDPEPLPAGHWMYSHPNVRLSAHVSWYTPELLARSIEQFVDNLSRFVAGQPLLDVVDRDEGY